MKKLSYCLMAVLFVTANFMFVNCTDKETKDPEITVNINGTNQLEVTIDKDALSDLTIVVDYTTDANIKEITFEQVNGTSLAGFPKTSGFAGNAIDKITLKDDVLKLDVGEHLFTTKVTDKNDKSANRTIKITVTEEGTNDSQGDFTDAKGDITVTAGLIVYYRQGSKEGKIEVTEASATVVKLMLDGKTEVSILDDNGNSYLKNNGTTYDKAGALADQASFLLAKKLGAAMLCTGNSSELNTKFPNATAVVFTTKTLE